MKENNQTNKVAALSLSNRVLLLQCDKIGMLINQNNFNLALAEVKFLKDKITELEIALLILNS